MKVKNQNIAIKKYLNTFFNLKDQSAQLQVESWSQGVGGVVGGGGYSRFEVTGRCQGVELRTIPGM